MKKTAAAFILAAGVLFLFSACGPDVVPESAEPPTPTIEPIQTVALPDDPGTPEPIRPVNDEEVGTRWKGVEVTVTEKKEAGQVFKVEIPLGGEATVEGTPLHIKLVSFVPDFAMGADQIGTKSLDDVNPAAKIEIAEEGAVLFTGWAFRDFPEMHAFDDPRFTIVLTRAVPVE